MIQASDYIAILPELVLTLFGVAVMMAEPMLKPGASRRPLGLLALAGALASLIATVYQSATPGPGFFAMVQV
ncbi:MAG: NADH-quinone oxidoreductase subunit N, partial [Nevskiales bacterium]